MLARAPCRSSAASVADVQTGVLYVDTSALVKLVVREAETDTLEEELRVGASLATSVVTSIEFYRAVARARCDLTAVVADEYTVFGVLASVAELPFNDEVCAAASSLSPVELRTLDAIHLASRWRLATICPASSPTTPACSEQPSPTASQCLPPSPRRPGRRSTGRPADGRR